MQVAGIDFPELTILTLICFLMGFSVVYFLYQNNENQLLQKEHFKRELLLTQLEIQEHTFQRIAQELHDNIGQYLALAKLHLVYRASGSLEGSILNATEIIAKCIEDIRNFSKELNKEPVTSLGFIPMIESFIEQIRKTGKFTIDFRREGQESEIQSDKELMLYRIIQEAFHNIIKHSEAHAATIAVFYKKSKELEMLITDDGRGFDVDEAIRKGPLNGSSGLQNIIRRVRVLGGKYEFISNKNKGTQLCITIPI